MSETAFVDRGPMAKFPNSKRRLVEVLKFLYEQTDDEHGTIADPKSAIEKYREYVNDALQWLE